MLARYAALAALILIWGTTWAGITVGLEFVNRYESNLLNTSAQTVEYIREIGSDNLVVHLDSYHMNIEEKDMHGAIRASKSRLVDVHIDVDIELEAVPVLADVRPHDVVAEVEDQRLHRVREARRRLPFLTPNAGPSHRHEQPDADEGGEEDEDQLARRRHVERQRPDVDRVESEPAQVEVHARELHLAGVLEVVRDVVRDLADRSEPVGLGRAVGGFLSVVGALRAAPHIRDIAVAVSPLENPDGYALYRELYAALRERFPRPG